MAYPMGESKQGCLRVDFDRRLRLEFHGSKVTTDAGFLAYRELDDALELTEMAGDVFCDNRTGKNAWHGMTGQFRQSLFGRLGGYDDVNDADRLGRDPAMRWIVGGKAVERRAASTSQMGRFETELLASDANIEALADMNGVWIDKVHGSWDRKRRVVAKVEWHPNDLYPRVGFIVTNLSRSAERVTWFYNQRGKAEQCIKESKNAMKWTRLSCRKFRDNAVRLQLHALAYNLGNFMRTLALPKEVEHWSLTTLREKLVKIGAEVVSHGRRVTFQLAEVALPRELLRKFLRLIDGLRPAPLPP